MAKESTATLTPKVLIADDSPDILQLMSQCVKMIGGFRLVTAEDGAVAIQRYCEARRARDPFDLLLLDAAMPHKTGFEVAQFVRQCCHDPVPIIIITAHAEPLNAAHADYVEATGVLGKPFDVSDFKNMLGLALAPPSQRVAAFTALASARGH